MPDNGDYFSTHVEVAYLNKPFFIQLKRVWRKVKTFAEPDKPKKIGFFLQNTRGLEGSAQTNEKIVKDIFGTAQQMSPTEFIKKIFSFEVPQGKKTFVKHETAYQETQRLVTGREHHNIATNVASVTNKSPREFGKSGGKKPAPEPLNKTIQVSIFGDIYEEILKKYKDHPEGDNIIRAINRNLDGHFTNAAAFVRWTEMTPSWIHIDAFQTDFFNKVKAMKFNAEKKDDKISTQVSDDFRHYEDEFFKAAVSYVNRSHPNVKIYTANTEDLVKSVENVHGEVKLKEYYYKLPKMLGFRLINLTDLEKKLHLGPEKNALEKHFKPALERMGKERDFGDVDDWVERLVASLKILQTKKNGVTTKEEVDEAIRSEEMPQEVASAIHQFLDELTEVVNKKMKSVSGKSTMLISNYLKSKKSFIKDFLSKVGGPGVKIWFADKRMLFENTRYNNRLMKESIRELAGL
jgi:hypothetical protein